MNRPSAQQSLLPFTRPWRCHSDCCAGTLYSRPPGAPATRRPPQTVTSPVPSTSTQALLCSCPLTPQRPAQLPHTRGGPRNPAPLPLPHSQSPPTSRDAAGQESSAPTQSDRRVEPCGPSGLLPHRAEGRVAELLCTASTFSCI